MLPLIPVAAIAGVATGVASYHYNQQAQAKEETEAQPAPEPESEPKPESTVEGAHGDEKAEPDADADAAIAAAAEAFEIIIDHDADGVAVKSDTIYVSDDFLDNLADELKIDPMLLKRGTQTATLTPLAKHLVNEICDLGTDNHGQAGLGEHYNANAAARKLGGKVINDGKHVYEPDGKVDKLIRVGDIDYGLQVKHQDRKVGNATGCEYADRVDLFASTNGFTDDFNPDTHGYKHVITKDDWLYRDRLKLRARQFLTGLKRLASRVATLGRQLRSGLSTIVTRLTSTAKSPAAAFLALGRLEQIVLIVAVIVAAIVLWKLYRWYQNRCNDDTDTTSDSTGTPAD